MRVKSAAVSRAFYADLGFWRVEGSDDEGWSVLSNGDTRIGLFEPQYMSEDAFSLNFRGGDVMRIAQELASKGHRFSKEAKVGKTGGASASLRDPDGYAIFLDCAPGEVRSDSPID